MIYFVGQGFENGELGTHLAARDDGGQWAFGVCQSFLNRIDLCRQQRPCTRNRRKLRDAIGGAFCTVGGAKSVVDKNVAECCQFVRQLRGIFLFALVDAAVFQHHQLAWRNLNRGDACFVVAIDPVGY